MPIGCLHFSSNATFPSSPSGEPPPRRSRSWANRRRRENGLEDTAYSPVVSTPRLNRERRYVDLRPAFTKLACRLHCLSTGQVPRTGFQDEGPSCVHGGTPFANWEWVFNWSPSGFSHEAANRQSPPGRRYGSQFPCALLAYLGSKPHRIARSGRGLRGTTHGSHGPAPDIFGHGSSIRHGRLPIPPWVECAFKRQDAVERGLSTPPRIPSGRTPPAPLRGRLRRQMTR